MPCFEVYRIDYPHPGEWEEEPFLVTSDAQTLVNLYVALSTPFIKDRPRKYLIVWRPAPRSLAGSAGLLLTRDSTGKVGYSRVPVQTEARFT